MGSGRLSFSLSLPSSRNIAIFTHMFLTSKCSFHIDLFSRYPHSYPSIFHYPYSSFIYTHSFSLSFCLSNFPRSSFINSHRVEWFFVFCRISCIWRSWTLKFVTVAYFSFLHELNLVDYAATVSHSLTFNHLKSKNNPYLLMSCTSTRSTNIKLSLRRRTLRSDQILCIHS